MRPPKTIKFDVKTLLEKGFKRKLIVEETNPRESINVEGNQMSEVRLNNMIVELKERIGFINKS